MGNTLEKLQFIEGTKIAIKSSLRNKGLTIDDAATFRSYAAAIDSIEAGEGISPADATAIEANVIQDSSFYAGDNDIKTGTMVNQGTVEIQITDLTNFDIPEGYHNGGGFAYVPNDDWSIIGDNIRFGVTILGIEGSLAPGISPDNANADMSQVLAPNSFYAGDNDIKYGTMLDHGGSQIEITGIDNVEIPDGYHLGGLVTFTNDAIGALLPENIKEGVTILGVTGIEILTPPPAAWTKPAEWIDISSVSNNEIKLLVSDGVGIAFKVTVSSGGTYSIDWGDGTVVHNVASGSIPKHHYNYSGGTYCPNLGYMVYQIRIYNATGNILTWKVENHGYTNNNQYHNILWAVFGTINITDYSNAFYKAGVYCRNLQSCTIPSFFYCNDTTNMFNNCNALAYVKLPESWGNVTNTSSMFFSCNALLSVTLPATWWGVTNTSNMFNSCSALLTVLLPESWRSVTNTSSMFNYCSALQSVKLPESWGNVTNTSSMFNNCSTLAYVTLPATWGSVTNVATMFNSCYSLAFIANLYNLGSETSETDMTDIFKYCEYLQGVITVGAKLKKLDIYGSVGKNNQLTGLRLTNASSTFTGTAAQVDCSYCNLGAAALNLLFGDLPTLAGKTIKITGCTGAATCDTTIATIKGWTVTN